MAGRAAELSTLVKRASELGVDVAGLGTDRMLPVLPNLRDLFPGGGLRRGSTVAITTGRGATTLLLATLAAASQAGSWCAVVGMPQLGLVAADELGISLERFALVPHPGPQWTNVVSVLLDGFDAVAVAVPGVAAGPRDGGTAGGMSNGQVAASVRAQLAARARQRGSVLIPFGGWDGADMTLSPEKSLWHGLGRGSGRLRRRELTICARGRGAAGRPRRTTFWLPGPAHTEASAAVAAITAGAAVAAGASAAIAAGVSATVAAGAGVGVSAAGAPAAGAREAGVSAAGAREAGMSAAVAAGAEVSAPVAAETTAKRHLALVQ